MTLQLRRMNGKLHKMHLYADIGIGLFALGALLFEGLFDIFAKADFAFHIAVVVLVFGGIAAERILHGHTHEKI